MATSAGNVEGACAPEIVVFVALRAVWRLALTFRFCFRFRLVGQLFFRRMLRASSYSSRIKLGWQKTPFSSIRLKHRNPYRFSWRIIEAIFPSAANEFHQHTTKQDIGHADVRLKCLGIVSARNRLLSIIRKLRPSVSHAITEGSSVSMAMNNLAGKQLVVGLAILCHLLCQFFLC
jgi:hypothetical protein